ncbi:CvpA family protein [Pseudorhodoferax sp. Leaf267]|uniref:CvpA family protein n=1 Tax=Pseudorhodoferax sp. Leaf267 TaxID=1736316 RepID=UPI0006F4AA7C|nr:CvpA family protein [Pseudorhodoferax sp. Leaf267]KQP18072.1 colicin V synthesis protein [Pseudorhodoferax sp. Leaf267]
MPTFDWVLLAVLVCSMVLGAWRGLVFEVLSVLGWVVAFVLAQRFAPDVGPHLPIGDASATIRYVAAFALIFVLVAFACGLVTALVKRLVQAVGLRPVDRVLGMVFGLLRGAILILAAGVIISSTPLQRQAWWQESAGADVVVSALHALRQALPVEYARFLP